jgi:hypothetical protein
MWRANIFIAFTTFLTLSSGLAGPIEDFSAVRAAMLKQDYATALPLLRSLVSQQFAGAKYMLGMMYSNGVGVSRDYSEAMRLQREAAEQGHPLSQYEVGAFYDAGMGVAKDQKEAARWFRRAAEQGYGMAQVNIGAMYATGEGVPRDFVEAYKWFSIAARGGGYMDKESIKTDATKRLNAISNGMTATQVSEGQVRARSWVARPERLVPH